MTFPMACPIQLHFHLFFPSSQQKELDLWPKELLAEYVETEYLPIPVTDLLQTFDLHLFDSLVELLLLDIQTIVCENRILKSKTQSKHFSSATFVFLTAQNISLKEHC